MEGVKLGRFGLACLIQIATQAGEVYLFDLLSIEGALGGTSPLTVLLERHQPAKLMYDCRNDADALFHRHSLRIAGVLDLQILYMCGQRVSGKFLHGLSKALSVVLPGAEIRQMAAAKARGRELFDERQGGDPELWAKRPLSVDLLRYAAADVAHLFSLYHRLEHCMPEARLQELTQARLRKAVNLSDADVGRSHKSAVKDFKILKRDYAPLVTSTC
eukprot:TRINITY_DN4677_c0_g1_i2.p1 TRINITY_DN4677_c0_g1~~TRINITY_DN4677_c0_g1_i2.p1  ORF type:complete len:217 (-),score=37.51 TRINITY_DN4677_c0_g1_i2:199-849(-)